MAPQQRQLKLYQTQAGRIPFLLWRNALKDLRAQARITERLNRLSFGLMGDMKPVGDGIHETRIDEGPGYRVYCLLEGTDLIVLLCAGTKGTQDRDIRKAKRYAQDYRRMKAHDNP